MAAEKPFPRDNDFFDLVHKGDLAALRALASDNPGRLAAALREESAHWVAACGGHIAVLALIRENGVDLMAGCANALRGAARADHSHVIDWLHQTGPVPRDKQHEAAVIALDYGHLNALKALERNGADLAPLHEMLYRCPSAELRAYLEDIKSREFAVYVTRGCTDALNETRRAQQRNAARMKTALRIFGL